MLLISLMRETAVVYLKSRCQNTSTDLSGVLSSAACQGSICQRRVCFPLALHLPGAGGGPASSTLLLAKWVSTTPRLCRSPHTLSDLREAPGKPAFPFWALGPRPWAFASRRHPWQVSPGWEVQRLPCRCFAHTGAPGCQAHHFALGPHPPCEGSEAAGRVACVPRAGFQ